MLLLLLVSLLIWALAILTGNLLTQRSNGGSPDTLFDTFWVGLAGMSVYFSYWSLWAATQPIALLGFCALLGLGYGLRKAGISGILAAFEGWRAQTWVFLGLLGLFSVKAAAPIASYDSGLYHIQAIKWIESYPVVPGLANLHDRFGFNPIFFNLCAGFSFREWVGQPIFPLNALIFTVFSTWIFSKIRAIRHLSDLLFWGLVGYFMSSYLFVLISSPSTDILAALLSFYILFRAWEVKKWAIYELFVFSILIGFALMVKLSTAPLILVLFWGLLASKNPKYWLYSALIGLFISGGWIARSYYLSGFLVFPFPKLDIFSPDWKVPTELVEITKNAIHDWAKKPDADYQSVRNSPISEWFGGWWMLKNHYQKLLLCLVLCSPLFFGIIAYLRKDFRLFGVGICAFFGAIFWFWSAPDIRFGLGFLTFAAGAWILGIKTNFGLALPSTKSINWGILGFVGLYFLKIGYHFVQDVAVQRLYLVPPAINEYAHYSGTNTPIEYKKIPCPPQQKAVVTIPVGKADRCFDQALPCAPAHNPRLRMRGERLEEGFRAE